MPDITAIPEAELRNDKRESMEDITRCDISLCLGATHYSGGSIQERKDTNWRIIAIIDTELTRRGLAP